MYLICLVWPSVRPSINLNEALNKHKNIVNKGLEELGKPLKNAFHYVMYELSKALHKLKEAIVHLRDCFHRQLRGPHA